MRNSRGAYLATGLLLLCLGGAIFRNFIFGDGILLYRDIGRDSLYSYYTDFVHLSNYIRKDGFPSWSFHIGMGQDMAYSTGFLFWEPVSWLPARLIARALVYQHLVKTVVAGLFFFRFLTLRKTATPVAILGAMVVAFSAYMTLGSCWYLPAEEVLAFSAILLGVEIALASGRWLWLALAIAFTGMINPFYLYLTALLLCAYVPCRLISRDGWQPASILRQSLLLAAISLFGIALGAFVTLPFLNVVLNSPRGSGATNSLATLASFPIFGLESALHYLTALFRPFANDIFGTGDNFRGWQNYFEAPQSYCGLICLLLLPQAVLGGKARNRLLFFLFLLWLIIPTVFPWFRYLLWLFKDGYYRTYSLFCVLGLVTVAALVLNRYLRRGPFNLWLMLVWTASLVGLLYLPVAAWQNVFDGVLRNLVALYLVFYAIILIAGRLLQKERFAIYLVLVLVALELAHFNYLGVSRRDFVRKSELTDGIASDSATRAALSDLRRDDPSFFRLTVLRAGPTGAETISSEPMLLDYYSTGSYGSFNDNNYIRFLAAVEALPGSRESDTRWPVGLAGNFVLSLFGGEKYALVADPEPFQGAAQYELVRRYGDRYLFRNAFSLPFGLVYNRYLSESEFMRLPRERKEQALLAVAVLDDAAANAASRLPPIGTADVEKELSASFYPAIVEQRRASAFRLSSFTQNRITGDVRLDQNGILVLQSPYSSGWRAYQDGQPISTIRADIGLLGLPVQAGEHKIELRYRNPWLWMGTITSASAALLLLLARWRWPCLNVITAAD